MLNVDAAGIGEAQLADAEASAGDRARLLGSADRQTGTLHLHGRRGVRSRRSRPGRRRRRRGRRRGRRRRRWSRTGESKDGSSIIKFAKKNPSIKP